MIEQEISETKYIPMKIGLISLSNLKSGHKDVKRYTILLCKEIRHTF